MHFSLVSLDEGHGFVKVGYRQESGEICTHSFRSVAVPHVESAVATFLGSSQPASWVKKVEVEGNTYIVDTEEGGKGGWLTAERNESNDFPERPEYLALALAALASIGATRVSVLVAGLPVHTYKRYAETLKRKFRGMHTLGTGNCVYVERVEVVPQPAGSLITLKQDGYGDLLATTTLLVDVGHGTTDWLVSTNLEIDHSRSGGRPGGAGRVYRAVAEALSAELAEPFENMDQIELALRNRTPLSVCGNRVDIARFVEPAKLAAVETARVVRAKVRSGEDLTLVLTGGGAALYRDAFASVFPSNRLVELDNARFRNVIGFVAYGELLAQRAG
jgi:plasmid segregation protein ParM